MDEIWNEGRFRVRNGGKRPDHKRQFDRGIQYRRTATANAEGGAKVIVAGIGMLFVVRSIPVFDAEKMVGYFHDTTATVATGHECQGEHIDGEYVDGYFH